MKITSIWISYRLINHILYWTLILLEENKFNGFVKGAQWVILGFIVTLAVFEGIFFEVLTFVTKMKNSSNIRLRDCIMDKKFEY